MADAPFIPDSTMLRHMLRVGSATQARADDDLTIDILRYRIVSAGQPHRGIAPTVALVAGLSGLTASIGQLGNYGAEGRPFDGIAVREWDRVFCVLDIPATTDPAVAAGTIQLTDFVRGHDGHKWRPVPGAVRNDPTTGQSVFVGRLWVR